MHCPHCGKAIPQVQPKFCAFCGQAIAQPQTPPAGPAFLNNPTVAQASEQVRKVAGDVAAELQRTLEDPNLIGRVPGRSVSIIGLAAIGLAILVSALPWFSGVGLIWSIIIAAGGLVVAVQDLRAAGLYLRETAAVPPQLLHPGIPPLFAALAAVQAFQLLSIGVVPLLWLAGTALLCYDQYRKAIVAPNSYGQYFDLRLAWYGYRKYIVLGAVVCLLAMLMTWGKTDGHFSGGYESRYSSYYGGYVSDYNLTKYYWPGWEFSGRSQSFSSFAVIALFGIVVWAAWRGNGRVPDWFQYVPWGLAGVSAVWWFISASGLKIGVWVFLLGLAAIFFALVQILKKNEHAGQYDLDHMMQRIRK